MRVVTVVWVTLSRLPPLILLFTALGWALMAGAEVVPAMPDLCLSPGTFGQELTAKTQALFATASFALIVASWLTMMTAMMAPLLAGPLLHVWRQSLSRRRPRAILLFLTGYILVWMITGIILIPGAIFLQTISLSVGMAPAFIGALVALIWQITPFKQLSLNRCHKRRALLAFGVKAEIDSIRFGAERAIWCVGTCWAFMLWTLLTDGLLHWVVMLAVVFITVVERKRAPKAPEWIALRWPATVFVAGFVLNRRGAQ